MVVVTAPQLTIAIPTWNRATFLQRNLAQLERELVGVPPGRVELLISDNASDDDTPQVVAEASARLPSLSALRNAENLGWGRNFLQCLQRAKGDYVMLLADDDFIVDGGLSAILAAISGPERPGSVTLGVFGFDRDFAAERPELAARPQVVLDRVDSYLCETALINTLLSATVLERSALALLDHVPANERNLAHFRYVLESALSRPRNVIVRDLVLASQRDNSSSYPYARVFVTELWSIYDAALPDPGHAELKARIKRRMLWHYYPRYLASLAGYVPEPVAEIISRCDAVFGGFAVYRWLFRPILSMPARPRFVAFACWTLASKIRLGELHAIRRFLKVRIAAAARRRN